jgi:hypothetical protein
MLGRGGPADAQNLVANGDFDSAQGVASWTAGPMTLFAWSSADWQGDPTSGSGRLTNAAQCASTVTTQCVELPPPLAASYELGAAVFLESTTLQASAHVSVFAIDGTSCTGPTLSSFQSPIVSLQGQWTSFLDADIPLPPSTRSVVVQLVVAKPVILPLCLPPLPPVTARFDHVRFGPTGTTPVTALSISVE